MRSESWLRVASNVVLGLLVPISCSSASPVSAPSQGPTGTFSAIYPMLFPADTGPKCNFCHSMPASDVSNGKLHLGMDRHTAYAALVGQTAIGIKCMGRSLVVAGQPDMSLLVQKFSDNPPCGERMPQGGAPIPDEQIEMVRGWIAAGAKDD
jgi:hypothetical protein